MNKYPWGTVLFLILVLCACNANSFPEQTPIGQDGSPLVGTTPTLTHTTDPALTATNVAARPTTVPSPTPNPTSTATPRVYATITRLPSLTPTLTPTPTLIPTLESAQLLKPRQPTAEEVKAYLLNLPTAYFHGVYLSLESVASDVNTFKNYRGFSEALELIYEDVNGDQQDDLIVTDVLLTAVFLWANSEYLTPFVIVGSEWKYEPASRTSFADWTNDGVPEVIFDYRSDSGGTGVRYWGWETFVIHCDSNECAIIWNELLTTLYSDYNLGGLTLFQSTIDHYVEDGQLLLERNRSRFSIYDSYYWPPAGYWNVPVDTLKVFTSTQEIYIWDGTTFALTETSVMGEPYIIETVASLEATYGLDQITITAENNRSATDNNDFCQLFLNEETVGEFFGCKHNFTTVEWLDVTADGRPEIVITAYSGARPSAFNGTWPDVDFEDWFSLSDIDCVHQHWLAYQWDGVTATKIADVEGCVVQENLYGVRLADLEDDGQVEIIAANQWFTESECTTDSRFSCWYEFDYINDVYKWNGSEFVLWGTVPHQ